MKKRMIYLVSIVILLLSLLILYTTLFTRKTSKSKYDDLIVVDVFSSLANYQGIQSGWFGKIVEDKFNMRLNIIAPNVAGGGDSLYDVRTTSGNLGDLIIFSSENGQLQNLVSEDLVLDMSSMLKGKGIMRFDTAITSLNETLNRDGIYAIPSEISTLPVTSPSEGLDLNYGPYLRWDLYARLGYPNISTLEDLLTVLKDMQKLQPFSDFGDKTYAFSFFKDWDSNLMNAVKQPICFYGYDEFGFVLAKADGSDYQSILDLDSLYMRVLKFYFEANQLGLISPASPVQTYDDVFREYQKGNILYSPWPWLGQSAYNTMLNKDMGKGFMLAPIDDMVIYSYGSFTQGNATTVIAIGSQAEDPERLADFIDWLYSPEGIQISCAQGMSGSAGPQGLTWDMGEDGPYLTEFGLNALLGGNAVVPEELGGSTWNDGVSTLNYKPVSLLSLDPNGYPYAYSLWDSVLAMNDSALDLDWKKHMNASSTLEYLTKNNQLVVAPGANIISPESTSEINTLRNQCRDVVVDYSWNMVFASTEEEFYSLQKEMRAKAYAFGYEHVYQEDLRNAKKLDVARQEAVAASQE